MSGTKKSTTNPSSSESKTCNYFLFFGLAVYLPLHDYSSSWFLADVDHLLIAVDTVSVIRDDGKYRKLEDFILKSGSTAGDQFKALAGGCGLTEYRQLRILLGSPFFRYLIYRLLRKSKQN